MDIEHICQIESSLQQSMPLCLINLIVQFCVDINALYNFHTSHYNDLIDILNGNIMNDVTDFVFNHLLIFMSKYPLKHILEHCGSGYNLACIESVWFGHSYACLL